MFKPTDSPRLFGLAPGVDFPDALVAGLRDRLGDAPPHAMAQVDLIVNTRRMARRLRAIFDAGPPAFLPRIHLLSDLTALAPHIHMPRPVPPLRRRLELVALVSRLLDANTGIAPRSSLYALSDSLADLIDEMQGEGVSAETVSNLDVSSDSAHWKHTQQFLKIADTYLQSTDRRPDAEAFQRQFVTQLIASWDETPPQHPVIVAGSTGSRGTTALLLQAVARLPQGALVLPGYDFDMPPELWHKVDADAPPEDHPQFRFFDLARRLKHDTARVIPWIDTPPPSPERNALVSLSLRPAPVTDTWLEVGPKLQQIGPATENVTLIEAANPRNEALTIAMRLRKAADAGQKAALITPDRMLTRQVTAALDRWNILPDDSAGTPLHLSPPGRLLRHAAGLFVQRLDAKALLALLKHPLTHSGPDRDTHQIGTLKLEALIRRKGLPYPDTSNLVELGKDLDQGWLA
ncbi:MAG: double-strand break repair protein AddB, partial [Pseudomonadota bacterium]